jgi:hypothetical protein
MLGTFMQDVARAVGDDDRRRRGYFADGCDAGVSAVSCSADSPTGAPLPASACAIAGRASTTSFASSASSGSAVMVYLLTVGLGVAQ